MEIHKYTSDNLTIVLEEGKNSKSTFDRQLEKLWEEGMRKGLFRYKLEKDSLPTKILPGKFNYIAQLNPERAEKRRKPQEIQSQNQPFNAEQFNFNKIREAEILLRLEPYWSSPGNSDEHLLLVNVSPLEYCHVLLTPFRNQNKVQKVTYEGLRLALELTLQSNSSDLRVGFNSLCGFASVNHEHWHAYYLYHRLFLEHASLKRITPDTDWFELEDIHFPPGFCILLKDLNELNSVLENVTKLTSYMWGSEIAHNLYITRASSKTLLGQFDSIRIYVWARQPSLGAKGCDVFNPALCELAGHFPIKNEAAYETLTEKYILEELHAICDEPFQTVRSWISQTKF